MITKERLEELIEKGATIYTTYGGYVSEIEIDKSYDYIEDNYFYEASVEVKRTIFTKYTFNILFETKEEAEWHLEFGCIERTERLKLPTWEEFRVISGFVFHDYKHNPISVMICLDPVNVAPCNDCIYIADKKNKYFCKPKTKENYIKACKKVKELFLGENK